MPSQQRTTKDYSKFVMNAMNRAITTEDGYKPRPDLVRSMKEIGFSPLCPLICVDDGEGKYTIIDGHNRLAAAQFLGLPVHYITYTAKEADQMSPLRYSMEQKPWSLGDMFNGFAHEGKDDYAEVVEYSRRTGISIGVSAGMFFGDSTNSNAIKSVRNGAFRIRDRITPAIVADLVRHIGMFASWSNTSNLVIALSKCVKAEGFDPKWLKEKVSKHSELLSKKRTNVDYIDMLEEIYNRFNKGPRFPLRMKVEEAMRERNAIKRAGR